MRLVYNISLGQISFFVKLHIVVEKKKRYTKRLKQEILKYSNSFGHKKKTHAIATETKFKVTIKEKEHNIILVL